MGFLIKSAFWLSLVLLLIPFNAGDGAPQSANLGPVKAFQAAREAATDVAGMCQRKPEVCAAGRSALRTIGFRARESAKIAYRMFDGGQPSGTDTSIETGDIRTVGIKSGGAAASD